MLNSTLNPILQTAIADVIARLNVFAQDPLFTEKMSFVFSNNVSVTPQQFLSLIQNLPTVEVLEYELQGALGAFSAQTNTIYLSANLLTFGQSEQLRTVLLEATGHYLDSRLNVADTKGDEGELFSSVVRGISLSSTELTRIQNENDINQIYVQGAYEAVETANANEIVWSSSGLGHKETYGTSANDILTATPANDFMFGYDGNDTIMGDVADFANYDTIQGVNGTDTIVMWGGHPTEGLTITTTGGWQNFPHLLNIAMFERFDLSDFLGTVNFTGGAIDDWIQFGTNNSLANLSDYVATGDGNDTVGTNLINLQQNDHIDGGNGTDTLVLKGLTNLSNLTINLSNANNPISGISNATISNFEYFEIGDYLGTVNFTGSASNEEIIFGISSGLPNQSDLIAMGNGDDLVSTSFRNLQQNDVIDGGLGRDTLIISEGNGAINLVVNVNNTVNQVSSIIGTKITNFERFDFSNFLGSVNFTGTASNDWIKLSSNNNPTNKSDTIFTGNGDDTVAVSLAKLSQNGQIDGGVGGDTLSITGGNSENNIFASITDVKNLISTIGGMKIFNFEYFDFTGFYGNVNLTGSAVNDRMQSGQGNDTLNGGLGADQLIGGLGNDTYLVDNILDVVTENLNEGNDLVQSTISTTLNDNVENLTLLGTANLYGTGNNLDNILIGNSGVNLLKGLNGNDTYIVDSIRDVVMENLNEGNDLVQSTVNTTLTNNVENLTLLGTANLYGTGNNLNNTLTGNSGANLLKGLNGNDTLLGSAGNDTLIGGLGNDRLTGEGGADQFLFGSGSAFKLSNLGVDTLTDFTQNSDKIALSKVTFNTLTSPLGTLQSADFAMVVFPSGDGYDPIFLIGSSSAKIVYNLGTGNLFYNLDGAITGLSSGSQFAILSDRPYLSATDFFVQA